MRKNWLLILVAIISFGYAGTVNASEEIEDQYDIDTKAKVKLVDAKSEMAVYSTNSFTNGIFDVYPHIIESNTLPIATYDNNTRTTGHFDINTATSQVLFKLPVDLTGFFLDVTTTYDNSGLEFTFYNANDEVIKELTLSPKVADSYYFNYKIDQVKKIEVKYVRLKAIALAYRVIREIDFFIDPASLYSSISNLHVNNVKEDRFSAGWTNTKDPFFKYNRIYLDDVLLTGNSALTSYNFTDLLPDQEYKITIGSVYEDGTEVFKHQTVKTTKDLTPPGDVTNATIKQENASIKINYILPTDKDLSHILIYKNGSLFQDNGKNIDFLDHTPRINQVNQYTLYSIDKAGNRSKGVNLSIEHVSQEIMNLKATAKDFTNVTLNWDNPVNEKFEIATIYRQEPQKENVVKQLARMFKVAATNDNFSPLFQTNGTMFKDMTVQASTSYQYKVTSLIDKQESNGMTVSITTPKVSVIDPEIEKNGDNYIFKWKAPTKGKVQINVGGQIYQTVPAADLKIIIPAAAMKYDFLGNPDVKLIPIDDDGNVGIPTNPSTGGGNGVPGGLEDIKGGELVGAVLNVPNLITLSMALLGLVGSFVLLGLAFLFVPKLKKMIVDAVATKRSNGNKINVRNNR